MKVALTSVAQCELAARADGILRKLDAVAVGEGTILPVSLLERFRTHTHHPARSAAITHSALLLPSARAGEADAHACPGAVTIRGAGVGIAGYVFGALR